jgi:ATP-dependent DNA helicase RecG
MPPLDLDNLLRIETDRIEWKESDREALEAVCALANDLGNSGQTGWLLLGIDKRGQVTGIDVSDEAQQRLINRLRSTKILPHPSVDVQPAERHGKSLLVVSVEPYPVPPIVRVDRIAWVRVGLTTHRASEADLARLQERRPEASLPFDLRPLRAASLDDLDLARLRQEHAAVIGEDAAAESFPGLEAWLGQRDIARPVEGRWAPTGAGLLVYGYSPQAYIPGATIEFARYAGADFDAPIAARKTIVGPLPDQLDALWALLNIHLAETLTKSEGMLTLYRPEYPLEALRELARNLVQHRIYERTNAPSRISWMDDRILFSNPGSRFGRAGEGEFGAHSDYRNPALTRLLVEQGYVERLGRGIRLVRSQLERNANAPLEVETDGFTTVTVKRRP